jgi:hypothetical protein
MSRALGAAILMTSLATMASCANDSDAVLRNSRRPSSGAASGPATSDDEQNEARPTAATVQASPSSAVDAGTGPSGPSAFANAEAYALITPTEESSDHHGQQSNANKDCLSCHAGGLNAPQFLVAGTVYDTKSSSAGASGVQVRIVDPSGNEIALVGTDSAGNFWLEAGTATLPPGSFVGVRDATSNKEMKASVSSGSCNQSGCHVKPRPIFLAD